MDFVSSVTSWVVGLGLGKSPQLREAVQLFVLVTRKPPRVLIGLPVVPLMLQPSFFFYVFFFFAEHSILPSWAPLFSPRSPPDWC